MLTQDSKGDKVSVVEKYKYYVYSEIKQHTRPPVFIERELLGKGFSSLYAVSKEDAEAISASGTTAGFKGTVWSEVLQIDIDSYAAADEAERRLNALGIGYKAYDTGNRGAHFVVRRDSAPSHLLPAQDKRWVKEHFEGLADLSIYTHLHLFRLPGTLHETGGREKVLVQSQDGKVLTYPAWGDEGAYGGTISFNDTGFNTYNGESIFRLYRVMSNSIPTKVGNRHPTFVKLLNALRDDAQVTPNIARWWLGEVNKMAEEPRTEEHLDQLVRSIFTV